MLVFLLYTIVSVIATASLAKILYFSIQSGQWLGKWQNVLISLNEKGHSGLTKFLGQCEMCFSHFISFLSFWVYAAFMNMVLNYWVTTPIDGWLPVVLFNIMWYLAYVAITTNLSLYFITKLFED